MLTLHIASSLILPTPCYVITPQLLHFSTVTSFLHSYFISSHDVITPQLCHYSMISQSLVYILDFWLGEPQLELSCKTSSSLLAVLLSHLHCPWRHWFFQRLINSNNNCTTEAVFPAKTSYMLVKGTSDSDQISFRMTKRKSSGP